MSIWDDISGVLSKPLDVLQGLGSAKFSAEAQAANAEANAAALRAASQQNLLTSAQQQEASRAQKNMIVYGALGLIMLIFLLRQTRQA